LTIVCITRITEPPHCHSWLTATLRLFLRFDNVRAPAGLPAW
jgi:hypothetical protein